MVRGQRSFPVISTIYLCALENTRVRPRSNSRPLEEAIAPVVYSHHQKDRRK